MNMREGRLPYARWRPWCAAGSRRFRQDNRRAAGRQFTGAGGNLTAGEIGEGNGAGKRQQKTLLEERVGLAAPPGLEPRNTEPKSGVLPITLWGCLALAFLPLRGVVNHTGRSLAREK